MDSLRLYLRNNSLRLRQHSLLIVVAAGISWQEKSINGRFKDLVEFRPSLTSTMREAGTSRTLSSRSIIPSTMMSVRMLLGSSKMASLSSSRRIIKFHISLPGIFFYHHSKMGSQTTKLINVEKTILRKDLKKRLSYLMPRKLQLLKNRS